MRTRRGMREARRQRSRRIRALLAAGLVLGVGAAATLAAWNDSEHTAASFTAGRFDIVGSVDGANFASHASAGSPATLAFTVPVSAMTPGDTTYSMFRVKTAGASMAGTLLLSAGATPGGTGLAQYVSYGVRALAGTTCDAASYNAATDRVVVPDGSALTVGATASQSVAANGASTVNYCFAVRLSPTAPGTAQGLTATQSWQILGTSS